MEARSTTALLRLGIVGACHKQECGEYSTAVTRFGLHAVVVSIFIDSAALGENLRQQSFPNPRAVTGSVWWIAGISMAGKGDGLGMRRVGASMKWMYCGSILLPLG